MSNIYLSTGNIKMKNVLIFSLPAIITCPYSTEQCKSKCYARKAERGMYPTVLPSRHKNLEETYSPVFAQNMIESITKMNSKRKKYKMFRIHESGEFYNRSYFEKWLEIIRHFPDITFLAFTKSPFVREYLDVLPENFVLYHSVWPDTKKENIVWELPLALAGDCSKIYNKEVFECPGKCDNCHYCFNKKRDVHFIIH